MSFQLIEVRDNHTEREFLEFPARLYRSDPNYIRPLDRDVRAVFDRKTNKLFHKGDAIRWILTDELGKTAGTVAAFYNESIAYNNDVAAGGMGFFHCINDQQAAFILFDACREWLRSKGLEAMDGPVNFGERDSFWGCLVDGFYEPIYNMPYNYPYYRELFESYGFENYFNQYTYHRNLTPGGMDPIVEEKAARLMRNPDYHFETINLKYKEKYAEDFTTVFNKAWARFPGVKKLSKTHAMALLKQMEPILDPRLMIYGYYKDEPIAFFIMMPDISQITRRFNGKFHLINKLRLLYQLKVRKSVTRVIGRIFGVVPEHQGKGVEVGLVKEFERIVKNSPNFPYTDLEMNWIGDFNPSMMKVCEQIGASIRKTHVTFRYLFDRSRPFQRARRVNI